MEKRFAPQLLKALTVNRETYTIRFVFSSPVIDRHGESIDQKGWILNNYLLNPTVLWGHDQSKFPIGKAANMGIIDGNLEGDVIFAYKENPEAAIAFELCAGGFLNAGSVGFMNYKWMYDENTDVLTLLENELYEFSIVNVPANPQALSKAIDGMKEKNVDKKVIDSIVKFQEKSIKEAEDRFKNLGEEVKEEEEKGEVKPDAGDVEVPDKAPEEVIPEGSPESEPTDEDVEKALGTLFRSKRETIKASVKELTSRLNDAQEDIKESAVDASPSQGLKKGLTNKHINSLVRSLLNSKS